MRKSLIVSYLLIGLSVGWLTSGVVAEEIQAKKSGGTWSVPVNLNGVLTLDFTIDSGAAEVHVPVEVVMILIKTGTVSDADFLPGATYVLADGSTVKSPRFLIRKLSVGSTSVENVKASIGKSGSSLLLGQSFLEKVGHWSMDTNREMLVLGQPVKAPAKPLSRNELFEGLVGISEAWTKFNYTRLLGTYETTRSYEPERGYTISTYTYQTQTQISDILDRLVFLFGGSSKETELQKVLRLYIEAAESAKRDNEFEVESFKLKKNRYSELQALQAQTREKSSAASDLLYKTLTPDEQAIMTKASKLQAFNYPDAFFAGGTLYTGLILDQATSGLVVEHVLPNSPGAAAGLRSGDLISTVNGREVADVQAYRKETMVNHKTSSLEIVRDGARLQKSISARRYIPFNKSRYLSIGMLGTRNSSISQDSTVPTQNSLYSRVLRGPSDEYTQCVMVSVDDETNVQQIKALKSFGVDYVLSSHLLECKEDNATRAFVGKIRVCEYKLELALYSTEDGRKIWTGRQAKIRDKFGSSNYATLELCKKECLDVLVPEMRSAIEKLEAQQQ